jgi:5-methylcytosine-specific restriction endonuclease McrBC regulatory subunit McrC
MVELGLRRTLDRRLSPQWPVKKVGLTLSPSHLTLNPDLVFDDGRQVGDVRYKLSKGEWRRTDLYQVVAFATGFRSNAALWQYLCPP